ncbi:dTMP kinase [uncultured Cohaesibacter sp.]|uniref:dTMP kinase n=1 Tax=uncultured Cohaesibacter sp. TaxID=1002546 RepID=UPI0029302130|nr:dTMP kinase [uncultured Cohaesibacter sp.]
MSRGKFITFEGGEGVGKSTQIRLLKEKLEHKGIDCIQSREPGGSPHAEEVRDVLLSGFAEGMGISPAGEAVLFAAARADHVDTIIKPALETGQWVLCDRFMDSTRIYQGESQEVTEDLVDILERLAINGVSPDITFILDLRADVGMARANKRRNENEAADRFEREAMHIHENRRNAFLKLARKNPKRCKVIDASQTIEEIATDIWKIVETDLLSTHMARVNKSAPTTTDETGKD